MRATDAPNYSLLGVMGDVHGKTQWTTRAVDRFAELGATHILQLGDFGVWHGDSGERFLRKVNKTLKRREMLMIVTLGNHEDYHRLETRLMESIHSEGFQQLPGYDHILFARRGQRWSWDGVDFCSLGGANSIDRYDLKPSISWWPQESISMGDVYRTIEGGGADIMLSHDCPDGVPILGALPEHSEDAGWSPEALSYAQDSRDMLRYAVDAVKPELLLHGHYHVYAEIEVDLRDQSTGDEYHLKSICLSKEFTEGNMAILEPLSRNLVLYRDWPRA